MSEVQWADRLEEVLFYRRAMQLWDQFWDDFEIIGKDHRGREIVKQLTRSVGSIAANIAEGYGRGFGKEYPQFLRIARGSACESRGWYLKSRRLLPQETVTARVAILDQIIGALSKTISTLEKRNR